MSEDVAGALAFVAVGAARIRRGDDSDGVLGEGLSTLRDHKNSHGSDHPFIIEELRSIRDKNPDDAVAREVQQTLDKIDPGD